jgi:hypothetical protein
MSEVKRHLGDTWFALAHYVITVTALNVAGLAGWPRLQTFCLCALAQPVVPGGQEAGDVRPERCLTNEHAADAQASVQDIER